jgi:hypothetical protein
MTIRFGTTVKQDKPLKVIEKIKKKEMEKYVVRGFCLAHL